MKVLILSFLILISGCQSNKLPEDVLRSYVSYRFSKSQNKSEILKRTTGTIFKYVENMGVDEFNQFSREMLNYRKKKLKINLKKCNELKCFITYTLVYSYEGFKIDEVSEGNENNQMLVGKVEETYKSGDKEVLSLVRSGTRTQNGIEVKKIAELDNIDGEWKISQVSNVKTYIEGKNEVLIEANGK